MINCCQQQPDYPSNDLDTIGEVLPNRQNVSVERRHLAVKSMVHVVTDAALVRYHAGSYANCRSWSIRSSRPARGER